MIKRKEHTPFYFNEEFDQVLRECDEARAAEKQLAYYQTEQVKEQNRMRRYSLAELKARSTLCVAQADDLKVDTEHSRVWLSRCGVDDGLECDNMVTVEVCSNGKWEVVETYQALN